MAIRDAGETDAVMDEQEQARDLVARAQKGDRGAFDLLIERYRGPVASYLRATLGDALRRRAVPVEDVLQDTAIRAYESLPGFRWCGDDRFRHWLCTIARHVTYGYLRGRPQDVEIASSIDVEAQSVSPLKALEREDRFERLKAAVRNLKPEHRQVILLARIRRLPVAEVAERMGRTQAAISQLLRRALGRLRRELGAMDTGSFGLPQRSLEEEEDDDGEESAKGDPPV